jgi:tight adherence protein B
VGVPIGDALRQSGERHPCREWEMFVDSTETLLKMGGQLAPMIDSVADTLRRRARVRERLMTLTAQGRAQGWVLGALPPFVLLALAAVDPHVFDWLTGTIGGWLTLGVAGGLELMALMWIRRLLRVDA